MLPSRAHQCLLYAISRPGALTAALNYYRCILRYPIGRLPNISVQTLLIWVRACYWSPREPVTYAPCTRPPCSGRQRWRARRGAR